MMSFFVVLLLLFLRVNSRNANFASNSCDVNHMQRFAHVSQLFLHFSKVLQKVTFRECENKPCKIQLIRNAYFCRIRVCFLYHAAKVNILRIRTKYFANYFPKI